MSPENSFMNNGQKRKLSIASNFYCFSLSVLSMNMKWCCVLALSPPLLREENVELRVAVKIKRRIHVLKIGLKNKIKWKVFPLVLFLAPFGQSCLLTNDTRIKFEAEIVLVWANSEYFLTGKIFMLRNANLIATKWQHLTGFSKKN